MPPSKMRTSTSYLLPPTYYLLPWYDNEWGYSNKMLEMVKVIAK